MSLAPRIDLSAWGEQPPLWIRLLANDVARCGTLVKVAEKLGLSEATVSTALRGCYPAGTERLEKKVLAAYKVVACAAQQGELITLDACQSFRKKKYPAHNPQAICQWVEQRKHCQQCPHSQQPARKKRHGSH